MPKDNIQEKMYQTFSGVASSLGYSEGHGRIIAVLLASEGFISLEELAKTTGYSLSTISISIDLLELIGMVKKTRKTGDRKMYVKFDGDLIEGLKNIFLLKVQKEIASTIEDFDDLKKETNDAKNRKMIDKLEKELDRLSKYIDDLSKVDVPE